MEENKKKALGRGLEELFNSEVLDFDSFESNILESASQDDIKQINLSEIRPNPHQPRKRFSEEGLKELAESIKTYGVIQPIIVKKSIKGYDLVAGERRVKAARMAGLTTIPAIIRDFSDDLMREIALLENLQREDLTAIELAWSYKDIIDALNITQDELAQKLGKSRSSVTNTLGLLSLPNEVQNMILNGKLSMSHARELSKMEDTDKILEYANNIVNNNLSVREVENISKNPEVKKKHPVNRTPVVNEYAYVEKELGDVFDSKVKISKNKIEIGFANANDLNRILEIMNIKIN